MRRPSQASRCCLLLFCYERCIVRAQSLLPLMDGGRRVRRRDAGSRGCTPSEHKAQGFHLRVTALAQYGAPRRLFAPSHCSRCQPITCSLLPHSPSADEAWPSPWRLLYSGIRDGQVSGILRHPIFRLPQLLVSSSARLVRLILLMSIAQRCYSSVRWQLNHNTTAPPGSRYSFAIVTVPVRICVRREVRTLDPYEANIFYIPAFLYGTPPRRAPRPVCLPRQQSRF